MKIINLKDVEAKEMKGNPLFTGGKVHTQSILHEGFNAKKIQIVNVKFAAGARNKFHTHSTEQILYVIEGKGIVATRDREYNATPGMAIFIPAGEEHWHGAIKDSSFTHLSILATPQEMKITEK